MSEKIRVLLDEETVEKRICEVAAQISEAYKGCLLYTSDAADE